MRESKIQGAPKGCQWWCGCNIMHSLHVLWLLEMLGYQTCCMFLVHPTKTASGHSHYHKSASKIRPIFTANYTASRSWRHQYVCVYVTWNWCTVLWTAIENVGTVNMIKSSCWDTVLMNWRQSGSSELHCNIPGQLKRGSIKSTQ